MKLEKGYIYHIYNQGNNRQKIFFQELNYEFFRQKIKTHILPYGDVLAYCLMPNHFHLMVYVREVEISIKTENGSIGVVFQAKLLSNIEGFAQSETLNNNFDNMLYWAKSVRSGDPDNYEARAAAYYWSQIFADVIDEFKRGREEPDPNHILNYGYAILRAIAARSLVASGLLPTLGIHHHNKYNAYALADDIMESYRPFVDKVVREIVVKYYPLIEEGEPMDLMPEIKKELLQIPAMDVNIDGEKSPLMLAMQRTTASLQRCFAGVEKGILYPELN